ncbi:hypothetical protein C0Q70_02530 [Pomacea canaliculata]|uniref:Uncharacterized protein n=1 Tax=Pomacea canaliculata TaxID=400727 RepID=A0A2T7PQB4_POMCA|nr:hypothetical protein C0Q70_02530 [Pomacea canaliculata]
MLQTWPENCVTSLKDGNPFTQQGASEDSQRRWNAFGREGEHTNQRNENSSSGSRGPLTTPPLPRPQGGGDGGWSPEEAENSFADACGKSADACGKSADACGKKC